MYALREEDDILENQTGRWPRYFYPRPPRGGRLGVGHGVGHHIDISIHTLREEGDWPDRCRQERLDISIHALREEGDATARDTTCRRMNFYPRPPRGGRQSSPYIWMMVLTFLSTPSVRRATITLSEFFAKAEDFYPRPPRGGRLYTENSISGYFRYFYPRPPRGGRLAHISQRSSQNLFLSTPSARRATASPARQRHQYPISIHALREEGDEAIMNEYDLQVAFLSTPSARRATSELVINSGTDTFLSTPSARRATP